MSAVSGKAFAFGGLAHPGILLGATLAFGILKLTEVALANRNRQATGGSGGGSTSNQSKRGSSNQKSSRSDDKYRKKTDRYDDPSSEDVDDLGSNSDEIVSVPAHLVARLQRFVRLGGIGQYVADQTRFARDCVFSTGRSQYFDRNCPVPGHHAAHVVRARINEDIEREYPEIFGPLRRFVAHTQNVEMYANVWMGLGGQIDRIQENFLEAINSIDYRGSLSEWGEKMLRELKKAFLEVLNEAVKSGKYNSNQEKDLREAIRRIEAITIEELFGKGRDGLTFLIDD